MAARGPRQTRSARRLALLGAAVALAAVLAALAVVLFRGSGGGNYPFQSKGYVLSASTSCTQPATTGTPCQPAAGTGG
jgi:hypothetical protein